MAPDRGEGYIPQIDDTSSRTPGLDDEPVALSRRQQSHNEVQKFLPEHVSEGQNFTVRGILVGLGVGLVICFSNMYFGLQTGWVSIMSMPASLMGFTFFKTLSKHLDLPFTPVENVLVQTVAGSMGVMPLGCGFVGVMPALNYMLKAEEQGPLILSLWKLILWALGLCYFGAVFAVPLRRQVIIREKLKFPSGTATALMINVLHGSDILIKARAASAAQDLDENEGADTESARPLLSDGSLEGADLPQQRSEALRYDLEDRDLKHQDNSWKERVKLLILSFALSGVYTLSTYFFPILRNLPVFGLYLARSWLWTLNPSLAYVGQGIIMGPATTLHMLLGAVVGWSVLSPLAKYRGWAPGAVGDWESGSRGWIVWVSLAIMLADSVVSLGYLLGRSIVIYGRPYLETTQQKIMKSDWKGLLRVTSLEQSGNYMRVDREEEQHPTSTSSSLIPNHLTAPASGNSTSEETKDLPDADAPPEHLISNRVAGVGLVASVIFCIVCIRVTFGASIPLYAIVTAVLMALILSVMGVRALGETDLNPVSGISKLAQLFFSLIIPQSNKNSVIINLIAGAISEAGAVQAGDLMQDLKTGHLLGAAPNAQFWGQIIGSTVGAVVSALIYRLYTSVYEVPGELFQVPTGYVWIFTARLVTGKGLPDMAWQWALGGAVVFSITTSIRMVGNGKPWHPYIPGGIAVAVGMYNIPSFTLARTLGGILSWYWRSYRKREETTLIVLASGLILGEGVMSIANLLLASLGIPHM